MPRIGHPDSRKHHILGVVAKWKYNMWWVDQKMSSANYIWGQSLSCSLSAAKKNDYSPAPWATTFPQALLKFHKQDQKLRSVAPSNVPVRADLWNLNWVICCVRSRCVVWRRAAWILKSIYTLRFEKLNSRVGHQKKVNKVVKKTIFSESMPLEM